VMQENCIETSGVVTVRGSVTTGLNIRSRGQDIRAGGAILARGRILRPQDLGLLASTGRAMVNVFRPLRVAILSTGNELTEPGTGEVPQGGLYNSNRFTLAFLSEKRIMSNARLSDSATLTCGSSPLNPANRWPLAVSTTNPS
jgi:molybdopterin molybdotransferase